MPFSFISPYCSKFGVLKMNYFSLYPHEPASIHHRITPAITSHIRLSSSLNKGLYNPLTVSNLTSCLLSHQSGSGRVVAWHAVAATHCGVTHCGGDTLWCDTLWRRHIVAETHCDGNTLWRRHIVVATHRVKPWSNRVTADSTFSNEISILLGC